MPERTPPDVNERERAPEEAATEKWLEDSGVYLTIPGGEPAGQSIDTRLPGGRQFGGAGE
jgi:hypothetical protein